MEIFRDFLGWEKGVEVVVAKDLDSFLFCVGSPWVRVDVGEEGGDGGGVKEVWFEMETKGGII